LLLYICHVREYRWRQL